MACSGFTGISAVVRPDGIPGRTGLMLNPSRGITGSLVLANSVLDRGCKSAGDSAVPANPLLTAPLEPAHTLEHNLVIAHPLRRRNVKKTLW